jgi:hypothetical protein
LAGVRDNDFFTPEINLAGWVWSVELARTPIGMSHWPLGVAFHFYPKPAAMAMLETGQ